MMMVFSWCTLHAVREVNQFVRYGYLKRLGVHIWLDEDQVTMRCLLALQACSLRAPSGGRRQIAIAAQRHKIEPLPRPLTVFLTILRNGQQSQLSWATVRVRK